MKKLTLKNYFFVQDTSVPDDTIEPLQDWLSNQMLHGKESRARTRFINLILPRIKETEEVRLKLLTDCAKKQKKEQEVDGKKKEVEVPVYFDKEGKETTDQQKGVRYVIQDQEKFVKEYGEYLQEDLILDITPSTSETIYGVRDLLLKTSYEFKGRMAIRYDEWCEKLEGIREEKKEEKTE